jgi:hypothetical protein
MWYLKKISNGTGMMITNRPYLLSSSGRTKKKQKLKIREMKKSLMTVKNLSSTKKLVKVNLMEVILKLMEITLISYIKNTHLMRYEHEDHQCG